MQLGRLLTHNLYQRLQLRTESEERLENFVARTVTDSCHTTRSGCCVGTFTTRWKKDCEVFACAITVKELEEASFTSCLMSQIDSGHPANNKTLFFPKVQKMNGSLQALHDHKCVSQERVGHLPKLPRETSRSIEGNRKP